MVLVVDPELNTADEKQTRFAQARYPDDYSVPFVLGSDWAMQLRPSKSFCVLGLLQCQGFSNFKFWCVTLGF